MWGNFGEKFASWGREDKIKYVWYFWSCEANSSRCAAIVRIDLHSVNQASNKIHSILMWLQWFKMGSEEEIPTPMMLHENAMYFIGYLIDQAQLDSHDGRTPWGICRTRPKISNVWFYPYSLARQIFHQNFPTHTRKRLSKPPRETVCSALSSLCAAGLTSRAPPLSLIQNRLEGVTNVNSWLLCTKWLIPSCLDGSVGRVPHKYYRGHEFKSHSTLKVLGVFLLLLKWFS